MVNWLICDWEMRLVGNQLIAIIGGSGSGIGWLHVIAIGIPAIIRVLRVRHVGNEDVA